MPQQRFYDYSKPASSAFENAIHYGLNAKGVYRGMDLGIDDTFNNITIAPGYGLQHSGVVWSESTEVTIEFAAPVAATTYTVVATHNNPTTIGGSQILYSLEEGELTDNDIPNGVVMGWVYYDPSTAPLSTDHLLSAPKSLSKEYPLVLVKSLPVSLTPPYPQAIVTTIGADMTFTSDTWDNTDFMIVQEVSNALAAAADPDDLIQQVQLYTNSDGLRPSHINLFHNFTNIAGNRIYVQIYDTDLTPVITPTIGEEIAGTGSWEETTVAIPRTGGTFDPRKPFSVRITYRVAKGHTIQTGRMQTEFWPYP